ncbi:hypothetical protein ACSSZE_03475 [Acidithiobacillus caldus]
MKIVKPIAMAMVLLVMIAFAYLDWRYITSWSGSLLSHAPGIVVGRKDEIKFFVLTFFLVFLNFISVALVLSLALFFMRDRKEGES